MNFKKQALCLITGILFFGLNAHAQTDTTQHINPNSVNTVQQREKPYVILISADGFRYDYLKKYQATHLQNFASMGVQAESMLPGYPSVTFPNHYSLVTGMYPAHHGLVSNTFTDRVTSEKYSMGNKARVRDGKWYGGTPLWVLAEQQQMIAASMFWVGSEAEIKGIRPTYYYDYTEKIPASDRIDAVKNWLMLPEEKRPHLITFYLSEPDHAGHNYGPESKETMQAVKMVDSIIYELNAAVASTKLPVNFIFVADHGMTTVDQQHPIPTPKVIDSARFTVISSGTMLDIRAKNPADIMPLYEKLKKEEQDYTAYLKQDMPKHLHYSAEDDRMNRIGDILLLPNWPKVFSDKKPHPGYHGFDPTVVKDMQATFIAWGPAFKSGLKIPSFENVNVYPLIAGILGLTYENDIDGKAAILQPILKK